MLRKHRGRNPYVVFAALGCAVAGAVIGAVGRTDVDDIRAHAFLGALIGALAGAIAGAVASSILRAVKSCRGGQDSAGMK